MDDARRIGHAAPGVLYIAGYGRSGSTILDVLLGAHPRVFGAGEVTHVFQAIDDGDPCACGEAVGDCPFWRSAFDAAGLPRDRGFITAAAKATRAVDRGDRIGFGRAASRRLYADTWSSLLRAIGDVSGASWVVDSSKTTRVTRRRPLGLRDAGLDVRTLGLHRHPAAVITAALRGTNRALASGTTDPAATPTPLRVALGWIAANRWKDPAGPMPRVAFEALLARPEAVLPPILEPLGLDVAPLLPFITTPEPIPPGHGIAGNRLRSSGEIRFRRADHGDGVGDTRARADILPPSARAALLLTRPVARRLGY